MDTHLFTSAPTLPGFLSQPRTIRTDTAPSPPSDAVRSSPADTAPSPPTDTVRSSPTDTVHSSTTDTAPSSRIAAARIRPITAVRSVATAAARMLCLITMLLLAASGAAVVPSARAQTEIPPLTGRVMDPADILSPSTEGTLTDLLRAHEDSTGNQIVVATVPSLEGEAIEEYALRAGRAWQIGTAENDNGILLIVAPAERKVRIEVGYGLEGAVPDAIAARIIRNEIIPAFRDGDFDAGVAAGTMALLQAAAGEYVVESSSGGPPPAAVRIIFSLAFGFMVVAAGFGALMAKTSTGRWVAFAFILPFAFVAGGFAGFSFWSGLLTAAIYAGIFIHLSDKPSVQSLRERMAEAAKKDKPSPVKVGPFTIHVGGSSGGGWGSSSSSSSGGGGGFSGGGGSFGGGGASGGW